MIRRLVSSPRDYEPWPVEYVEQVEEEIATPGHQDEPPLCFGEQACESRASNEMARRIQKSLEALAREIAHRGEGLSSFERQLFWTRILWQAEPARALAAMEGSACPLDRTYFLCATTAGIAEARLVVLVDLAITSFDESNPAGPSARRSPLGSSIFAWHDWPSFEIDLQSWLTALPKADLARELKKRVAAGLLEGTADRIAKHAGSR